MASTRRRGRNEGGVERMPDGRYRTVLSLGKDAQTGKRLRRRFYGKTKQEALAKLREAHAARATGQLVAAGSWTTGHWIRKWLEMRDGKVAQSTHRYYDKVARLYLLPTLCHVPLGKIAAVDVEHMAAVCTRQGRPAEAQRKASGDLRSSLRTAFKSRLIRRNHATDVQKRRAGRAAIDPYTAAEAARLLAAASANRVGAWFHLMVDGG